MAFRFWIGSESGLTKILDAMKRKVAVDQVRDSAARLRRRGIEVGIVHHAGLRRRGALGPAGDRRSPEAYGAGCVLTTLSYPIKGTPYYHAVADRLSAARPWHESTDRDLVVRGRPVKTYYDFARRWMTAEVARDQHWRRGRYARAARAASSALVGRVGMAVTEHWRQR